MRKKVLFDLDGTIIDSSEGIYGSIQYAMEKMGKEQLAQDVLRSFVGPPLIESFRGLGFDEAAAQQAVAFYRENYRQAGMFQVQPYPLIEETLQELAQDHDLYIATSKPEVFAKEILTHLKYDGYFKGIYGADLENKRGEKAAVIRYALTEIEKEQKVQQTIMIGDREHDILGAKENQLPAIGVLYGFGSKEELLDAGAIALAAETQELLALIPDSL